MPPLPFLRATDTSRPGDKDVRLSSPSRIWSCRDAEMKKKRRGGRGCVCSEQLPRIHTHTHTHTHTRTHAHIHTHLVDRLNVAFPLVARDHSGAEVLEMAVVSKKKKKGGRDCPEALTVLG
ncbi:hypothetical protein LY76DRAFT_172662 [Colletotrichum caudatum]|nr:hypothetical protein LY76DRAFT_172662 [Colletotrichum caudatum]